MPGDVTAVATILLLMVNIIQRPIRKQKNHVLTWSNSILSALGCSLEDCIRALYRIPIRSKKYFYRLIFHIIDMVIINSWKLYKRDANNLHLPGSKILQLSTFKLRIAVALMKSGKPEGGLKGRRLSAESSAKARKE